MGDCKNVRFFYSLKFNNKLQITTNISWCADMLTSPSLQQSVTVPTYSESLANFLLNLIYKSNESDNYIVSMRERCL